MNIRLYTCLRIFFFLVISTSIVHLLGNNSNATEQNNPDKPMPTFRVQVKSLNHTVISSLMAGQLLEVNVLDGESFEKGQQLASLDCSLPKAQLKRATATLNKHAALYETTQKLQRLKSRSPLEMEIARAEKNQAEAELEMAKQMIKRCNVNAPFSGRVAERMVQPNQFVNEGQPMFTLVDPNSLELEFIAPSIWLPWFKPGYKFIVHIDETNKDYQAELVRLGGTVDAVSQSIKAYARFTEAHSELLPGMSGGAIINSLDGN
ncbi:efflux RND transporter periplasmic adaptor subunit [Desulfovibrio litoralis]|uniref:RND family efflux transporter, MFP subunit n=1 Tax=Desulfovibrio litoralis DSM 11393 TaxID=1121455 RepID=A0A1M7SSI7_9BACT|nr:efflux RND transporter periplasmic adaptor subunit [Desulfovibrio litoralis]SHN61439.1 RND family efflux transporter, MFP subunit [Desulfovibrio litoralis DSM 11393]